MTHFRSLLAVGALTLALAAGLFAAESNTPAQKKTCNCPCAATKATGACTKCSGSTQCVGGNEACSAATQASGCCAGCTKTGQACAANECTGTCCQSCPICAATCNQCVVRVYNVAHLLGDPKSCSGNDLSAIIARVVEPASWTDTNKAIEFFPGSGSPCLIIRQTPMVHEQIAHLLTSLEQTGKQSKPAVVLFRAGEPGPIAPAVNYQLFSGSTGTLGYCDNGVCAMCGHGQMAMPGLMCPSCMPFPVAPSPVVMQPCPTSMPANVYFQSSGTFAVPQPGAPAIVTSFDSVPSACCSGKCCGSNPAVMQTSATQPLPRRCCSTQYSLVVTQACTPRPDGQCDRHLTVITPSKGEICCDNFSMMVAGQPVKVCQYPNVELMQLRGDDWEASAHAACLMADGKRIALSGQVRVHCRHGIVGEQVSGQNVMLDMSSGPARVQAVCKTAVAPSTEACETPETDPDPLAYLLWSSLFGSW